MVDTYWHIGKRIVQFEQSGRDRADYGEKLIMNLSRDLSAVYGKGFDERNLRYMRKFYILYLKRYTMCTNSKNRNAARSIMPGGDVGFVGDYLGIGVNNHTALLTWCDCRNATPTDGNSDIYAALVVFAGINGSVNDTYDFINKYGP